jgi:hypothetical protein
MDCAATDRPEPEKCFCVVVAWEEAGKRHEKLVYDNLSWYAASAYVEAQNLEWEGRGLLYSVR